MNINFEIKTLLEATWPRSADNPSLAPVIKSFKDVSQGRGVFSRVFRVELAWSNPTERGIPLPTSVVTKLPAVGDNRTSAIESGAYAREALAYQQVLQDTPISTPQLYGIRSYPDGAVAFALEDLTAGRAVDQIDGLSELDTQTVAEHLGRLRYHSTSDGRHQKLARLDIRRSTPSLLSADGLTAGLQSLERDWSDVLSSTDIEAFNQLVNNRSTLIEQFQRQPVSFCHGDVRADNLVFDYQDSSVVFYDWQQIALQVAEADLAWLTSTSMDTMLRRRSERDLVAIYAAASNSEFASSWDRYRIGMVLPGLSVLFLAQRELTGPRSRQFIAASLQRIAQAIIDHQLS